MSFTDLPVFKLLGNRLTTLAFRQKLLAQNLANIQTPHQKAIDIDPNALQSQQAGFKKLMNLKKTNDKHIAITSSEISTPMGGIKTITSKDSTSTTIQGNNISLEEQLQKVEETRLSHQVVTMLYRKNHDLLRSATQLGKA